MSDRRPSDRRRSGGRASPTCQVMALGRREDEDRKVPEDALRSERAAATARPKPEQAVRATEIARMVAVGVHPDVARKLQFREEPDASKDKADDELRGLMASFERARRAPAGPMPIRASSDAGDFVQYSTVGAPASAREQPPEPPSVVLAAELQALVRRDAPTVLIPGRGRRWSRGARLGMGGVLAAVVLVSLVAIRRSRQEVSSADDAVPAVLAPSARTAASETREPDPPPHLGGPDEASPATVQKGAPIAVLRAPSPPIAVAQSPGPTASARRVAQSARRSEEPARPNAPVSPLPSGDRAPAATESRQHYLLDLP